MKKLVVILAFLASLLVPTQAQAAQAQFTGSPLTNLESQGANVVIILNNFPTKGGLYLQQCVEDKVGVRPAICNKAAELWISTSRGASFTPTSPIVFKPTGTFTSGTTNVDCTISKCGAFLRYDHTVPGDLTEDQFIALTFKATGVGTVVIAPDEINATINGVVLSTKAAFTLAYRQFATMVATSKAGASLTFESLSPECTVVNGVVTALTGTGFCSIAVNSTGNTSAAATTVRFPIQLTLATQNLGSFTVPTSIKTRSTIRFPMNTNFGEKIRYRSTGACSIILAKATIRKGTCTIMASAPAKNNSYLPLMVSYTIESK